MKHKLDWSVKLNTSSNTVLNRLVRDRFITDDYTLTEKGEMLLQDDLQLIEHLKSKKKETPKGVSKFEEFWSAFPRTDKYAHHIQTRVLRADKTGAINAYNNIILEGKVGHDDLMRCLEKDIEMRKKASLGLKNEFKFMPGPSPWLNKRLFEAYLDEAQDDKPSTPGYGETLK